MMDKIIKEKKVVIREGFVKITGDFIKAVILQQFFYWSERVKDFDKFILEERERALKDGTELNMPLQDGWIYKTAEELSQETMLGLAPSNMRRHITALVRQGFLDERYNPAHKWDRTKQYRVNLVKIAQELCKLGYQMSGYKVLLGDDAFSKIENAISKTKNCNTRNRKAIPEITTDSSCSSCCSSDLAEVTRAYHDNGFGTITAITGELLDELIKDYSAQWVIDAMKEATRQGKRKLSYVEGILQNWKANGRDGDNGRHQRNRRNSEKTPNATDWENEPESL